MNFCNIIMCIINQYNFICMKKGHYRLQLISDCDGYINNTRWKCNMGINYIQKYEKYCPTCKIYLDIN